MKENEAIEWIKELKLSEEIREFYYAESYIKAFDMAIQALEEVQQYRQFGTVEECREAAEKQNPKEPDYEGDGTDSLYMIPGFVLAAAIITRLTMMIILIALIAGRK